MCVCMCVFVCVCVCERECVCIYVHACICARVRVCIMYTSVCACVRAGGVGVTSRKCVYK